jgi:hypothetical protein
MSKDPLAAPAIMPASSHEAEYDAVYAAVTATERGRWFLAEYANRNRRVDTEFIVAAVARIEAAVGGAAEPPPAAGFSPHLTGIVAAVERIQDVSFGLRERAVDATLCDALDAAAREIAIACAGKEANGKPARAMVELLRDLGTRVDALIALSLGDDSADGFPGREPAQVSDEAPIETANDVAKQEPENAAAPATAIAAIEAESAAVDQFVARDEGVGADPAFGDDDGARDGSSELASSTAAGDETSAGGGLGGEIAVPVMAAPNYAVPIETPVLASAPAEISQRWYIEAPDFAFHQGERETENERVAPTVKAGQVHALLPETQLHPGPEEDPADLFDVPVPLAAGPLVLTPIVASVTSAFGAEPAPIEPSPDVPPLELRVAAGQPVSADAGPVASDPLAALRALSAEELIALFG